MAKKQEGIYGSIRINKSKYLEKFKELYDQGMNDSEIARFLRINNVTVSNWRNSMKLPKNFKYKRKFDTNKFIELYNKGLNYSDIAKCLNCSSSAIQEYASSLGLKSSYHTYQELEFTNDEFQILLGTLLGDGYLRIGENCVNASGHFAHSRKQRNYCIWKGQKLSRFCSNPKDEEEFDKRTQKTYYSTRVRILAHPLITKIYNMFYSDGRKHINEEILNNIDSLGLAVWFMDDGYYYHEGFGIATNCFSIEELQLIVKILKNKFNLEFRIQSSNNTIRLLKRDVPKFIELIKPYIHEDCIYKLHLNELPKTPLNGETPEMDNTVLNLQETGENAERLEVMPNK